MKTDKPFDAVQTMRQIRDSISAEIAGMSHEEERRYIDEHLRKSQSPEEEKKNTKRG